MMWQNTSKARFEMDIMQDGVEVFCLLDTARCTLANKSPFDIDDCLVITIQKNVGWL